MPTGALRSVSHRTIHSQFVKPPPRFPPSVPEHARGFARRSPLQALPLLLLLAFLLSFLPASAHAATVIFLTSGTSWTVPSDWNSANNTIEVIAGGGGGGGVVGNGGGHGAGGGGGGGYSKASNISLTSGGSVTYAVGSAGSGGGGGVNGTGGGNTYFCNSTSNCASISGTAVVVGANGGSGGGGANGGSAASGGSGGSTTGAVGSTQFAGGGGSSTNTSGYGGGGGGGAAGPHGNGANGGSPSSSFGSGGAGGGGGADAGSVGSNGSGQTGGSGGNNRLGSGGGTSGGGSGSTGGGGGGGNGGSGASGPGGAGGAGEVLWTQTSDSATAGPGGGGGAGGAVTGGVSNGGAGGNYGAGGGGAGYETATTNGGNGKQGLIVITYTPAVSPPTVTTNSASAPTPTAATLFGSITNNGGADATQHGFAYGTVANLSTVIATTTDGAFVGTGSWATSISSLSANTTYYYRAYATNSGGTGYGSILSFTTGNSTPARKMRLFEGARLKLISGRLIIYQQ